MIWLLQDVMEEKCASAAICFVSFLPDILDSKAEGRNKYLELLLSVAEKFKKSPYRQGFFSPLKTLAGALPFNTDLTKMCLARHIQRKEKPQEFNRYNSFL
jgi:UDP-N-acetylglucosamine pyrophosphorylase